MKQIPEYQIKVYGNQDELPAEAEAMFGPQLADTRQPLPVDRRDRGQWRFALTCAVTACEHVLGGVYLDIGPVNSWLDFPGTPTKNHDSPVWLTILRGSGIKRLAAASGTIGEQDV
jgi:hypothetical protein